jgi:hypothetical protein
MESRWIGSETFADLYGITARAARKAIRAVMNGKPYRGKPLEMREVPGRGGRAGVQYQVRVDSLPSGLQERLKASPKAVATPSPGSFNSLERALLDNLLADILKHPPRTDARSKAIEAASQREIISPKTAQFVKLSPAKIRRLLKRYEAQGLAGLS